MLEEPPAMNPRRQVTGERQSGHQSCGAASFGCARADLPRLLRAESPAIRTSGIDHATRLRRQLPPTAGSTQGIVSEALNASPTSSPLVKTAVPRPILR